MGHERSCDHGCPGKYALELCERAVRMYHTSDPKPQIKNLAVDLGVHPEALRGWIRQAEADATSATTGSPPTVGRAHGPA
ncbi:transposase [Streptomyces sp. NPDC058534]|uniref:transposase n=1 Tax=Streptomyces sp. NPDC058534 TaxID=3346541 RepID=UPI00365D881F